MDNGREEKKDSRPERGMREIYIVLTRNMPSNGTSASGDAKSTKRFEQLNAKNNLKFLDESNFTC